MPWTTLYLAHPVRVYAFVISVVMVFCKHSVAAGASLRYSVHCMLTNNVFSALFV